MKIQHHLSEKLIMGYAAGILPEAFELAVATHISMCDECRAAVEAYEAVGGSVLDNIETMAISDDIFEATLAKISGEPAPPHILAKNDSIFPSALQHYVGESPDEVKWTNLGMGVKQAILKTSKGASARLLHIEAGRAVPDHGHRGTELTLVLQGAFSDEVDRFSRGDIEIAGEDLEHTPRAEMGVDCICLAVTDAPLRFNAIIPRLLQPFFRI